MLEHWSVAGCWVTINKRKESSVAGRKLTVLTLQRAPSHPSAQARKGSALAHPDEHRTIPQVEADRLRLIHQRLQADFYEVPPASEHIAAAVLADLTDLEEGASSLPH